MAEPHIVLVTENTALASAIMSFDGVSCPIEAVRQGEPASLLNQLAARPFDDFSLLIIDLALPEASVEALATQAIRQGIPWLAVAGAYNAHHRERAEALDAIDFVVADADDAHRVGRFVARLRKNRLARVLVVEDSSFMRLFVRRQLRRYQFRVHMAGKPEVAVRILKRCADIAAVIIDYDMPGQNGVELTRAIRRQFRNREMCLIGISGKAPRSVCAEFLKNGGDDYLHKPFGREELYCRVLHGVEAVERMQEIKRLERLRRMFLSMLAHDLKSPAGGISATAVSRRMSLPAAVAAARRARSITRASNRPWTMEGSNCPDSSRVRSCMLPAKVHSRRPA